MGNEVSIMIIATAAATNHKKEFVMQGSENEMKRGYAHARADLVQNGLRLGPLVAVARPLPEVELAEDAFYEFLLLATLREVCPAVVVELGEDVLEFVDGVLLDVVAEGLAVVSESRPLNRSDGRRTSKSDQTSALAMAVVEQRAWAGTVGEMTAERESSSRPWAVVGGVLDVGRGRAEHPFPQQTAVGKCRARQPTGSRAGSSAS